MARAKRDTYNYNLKQGRKIVYKGTTNNLEKREFEHKSDGKIFTHIQKVGRIKTSDSAAKEEERQLNRYRINHDGNNPKYNKTNKG